MGTAVSDAEGAGDRTAATVGITLGAAVTVGVGNGVTVAIGIAGLEVGGGVLVGNRVIGMVGSPSPQAATPNPTTNRTKAATIPFMPIAFQMKWIAALPYVDPIPRRSLPRRRESKPCPEPAEESHRQPSHHTIRNALISISRATDPELVRMYTEGQPSGLSRLQPQKSWEHPAHPARVCYRKPAYDSSFLLGRESRPKPSRGWTA